jgi:hypothetical protein
MARLFDCSVSYTASCNSCPARHNLQINASMLTVNGGTSERSLLSRVSLQPYARRLVFDIVRRDGRVVRHLLDNEVGLTATAGIWPDTVEYFAQDRVEGLMISLDPGFPSDR